MHGQKGIMAWADLSSEDFLEDQFRQGFVEIGQQSAAAESRAIEGDFGICAFRPIAKSFLDLLSVV